MTWTSVGQFGRDEVDTRCVPMCVFGLVNSPFLVLSVTRFVFSYLACIDFYSLPELYFGSQMQCQSHADSALKANAILS